MTKICVDAAVLGSARHMVFDGQYTWSDSVPRDSWHLSGRLKGSRCLDTILKIDGIELPAPPASHTAAWETVTSGSVGTIPWRHALPREQYKKFFQNTMDVITSIYQNLSYNYYESTWGAGNRVMSALKGVQVDPVSWQRSLDEGGTGLEGFRPNRSGYAAVPTYDRFSTRTGRLTITDGPNILVLRKDLRSVMRSAFMDGVICSLDFRALEARVVLAEAGRDAPDGDMYDAISQELFGGDVDRSVVKTAVLGELYGAGRASLAARLRVPDEKLDAFVAKIRTHFGIQDLANRLRIQLKSAGKVRSRFGRPHHVDADARDAILVNTFAQSTGVDVSLQGFDAVLQRLGTDGVRPLFVLHDAIILDVRRDRLPDVESIRSISVPTYESEFPLKYESISVITA